MIKELERTPLRGFYFKEGLRRWQLVCDVCGREDTQVHVWYEYGFGNLGFYKPLWSDMIFLPYGKLNVRNLLVCVTHRDAEIEEKIKELI